jgi:hypothetical protein
MHAMSCRQTNDLLQQNTFFNANIMAEFGVTSSETPPVPTVQIQPASRSSSPSGAESFANTHPAPAILFSSSNALDPAPPYSAAITQSLQESGMPVVNNFFFALNLDGARRRRAQFGPAITAMLVSLNMHTRYWPEIKICTRRGYSEEDWPDVLHVCGVPESHIPYLLLLISAENVLPVPL